MGGSQASGATMLLAGLLIVGIAMSVFGIWWYRRGRARYAAASAGWTRSEATIDASRIQVGEQMANDFTTTTYRPIAAYRYQAGGAERSGNRVFLCARTDWNSEKEANGWLAANPAGARVPVWFDPARPDEAALVLNMPSLLAAIVMTGVGVFLLVIGGYLVTRMTGG